MEEFLPVLRRSALFTGIRADEISSMLTCLHARRADYQKGEYLLRVGDRADHVGLLLSGSALIVQENFWGARNLVSQVQPGQLFAEAFACSPGAALTIAVEANEDCSVLWLGVQQILTTCPTACVYHTRMIRNLLSDLADKNLRFNEKLSHLGQRTTKEKLLSYLSAEAQRQGSEAFDIPFTRQQLADYLSVERSAMSAELGKLRDEGVLTFEKNHFHLLAPRE